jgi:hypothetical protein
MLHGSSGMTVKRAIPTYEQPLTVDGKTSASWRRWMHDTEVGTPPSNEVVVVPSGSPFAYQAPSRGAVVVSGGTVSKIQISRTSMVNYTVGVTAGMFPMALGDVLTVTYSGIPTMVFIPS